MLEFPIEFFDDEIRDGFYVPSIMKHCWAGQMEVLNQVDIVCKKYNIKYFIFSGTLIGAIRHGGYIPWDDDLDICMLREDYMKFIEVAEKELPERYAVRNMHTNPKHREIFSRVQNDTDVALHPDFWEKGHGFICNSAIDVFPLDYIPSNPDKRKEISNEILQLYFIITEYDKYGLTEQINGELGLFEKKYNKKIKRDDTIPQQLFLLMEDIFCSINRDKCENLQIPFLWIQSNMRGIPIKCFENTTLIPFETALFSAPVSYDEVLKNLYGQYMTSLRICDIHDYPWYKIVLDDVRHSQNLTDYPFISELLPKENRHKAWENKLVSELNETLEIFEKAGNLAEQSFNNGDVETGNMLLEKCQILASNAENIEKKLKGNGKERVIFLTFKSEYWKYYDELYRKEVSEGKEVLVVPVPYTRLTETRERTEEYLETEGFPEDIVLTDFATIDYKNVRIIKIYTQNIYDDQNGAISLRPFFYTSNIREYTDELIYVPWFELDVYGPEDERAIYMQQYFVRQPGIVAVDKILLSKNMSWIRDLYIDDLVKWAGKETKDIWEKKIEISDIDELKKNEVTGNEKKSILYYIGTGQILSNPKKMLEKINKNYEIFDSKGDKIFVKLYLEYGLLNNLKKCAAQYVPDFNNIYNKYKSAKWCKIVDSDSALGINNDEKIQLLIKDVDAFYGDAGVLMHIASRSNKPVLLQSLIG